MSFAVSTKIRRARFVEVALRTRRLFCAVCAFATFSPYAEAQDAPRPTDRAVAADEAAADATKPRPESIPSKEECQAFAETFLSTLKAGDIAAVNKLFDWDEVFRRSTEGVDVPEEYRNDFIEGARSQLDNPQGIVGQIVTAIKEGGGYKLLRVRETQGRPHALFRIIMVNTGVSYHEFPLQRGEDGSVRATDALLYSSGEYISDTLRRLFIGAAASSHPDLKIEGDELGGDFVRGIPTMTRMTTSLAQGQPGDTLAAFTELPPALQKDKSMLLVRLFAAQRVGIEPYRTAMAAIQKQFPNDPTVDLLLIDYHAIEGRIDAARQGVDRLDKSVGGDPYLHVMRSGLAQLGKDLPAARRSAEAAVAAEPDLVPARLTLINCAMRQEDFAEVAKQLLAMENELGQEIADLTNVEGYAPFVRSAEYRRWMEQRGKASNAK